MWSCSLQAVSESTQAWNVQAQSELELYTQPENKMPLERISVSSDAFGSAPVFDRHGKLTRYEASDWLHPPDC